MNYVKIIRLSGTFFAREYTHRENMREVREYTVLEQFLKGKTTVTVVIEDSDKEDIVIDPYTDKEIIRKYLGAKYIK